MPRRKQPAPTAPAGQRPPSQDSPDPFERALAAARAVLDAPPPPPPPPHASPWEVLADLPRADGTRFRVSSRPGQYGSAPMTVVAVCEQGRDGRWYPMRAAHKAVAVRERELPAAIEALVTMLRRSRDQASAADDGGEP